MAAAKRAVFGQVGIDMIAGPSRNSGLCRRAEQCQMVSDGFVIPQAEHDTVAQAVFITPDEQLLSEVEQAIEEHLLALPKAEIAAYFNCQSWCISACERSC